MASFPPVPLTLEGSFLLHQFFRFDWKSWRSRAEGERAEIAAEAVAVLNRLEGKEAGTPVQTALFSQLGHKGDLVLIHFRESL
ncbi:MAG: heme-dependent peroxidase, partial [Terracidiphilus sp.]